MAIYLLITLDTKADEAWVVRERLRELGLDVCVVDTGCLGEPPWPADVTRESVFAAAGTSVKEMQNAGDRGQAVTAAALGAATVVEAAHAAGKLSAVMGLGGSAGTTIATTAMQRLPIGIPKVMVSTLASGQVRPYVGDKDIVMMNSVVDIAGINRISRQILGNAAAAVAGMVQHRQPAQADDKRLIAATMFGVTTPCVQHARQYLEQAGFEVLVFHATGNGGQAMESLIREGVIDGVLDVTTTELADELFGGVLSAGPDRLSAAADVGIPQVVSVGATDMVNFGPRESVPDQFETRQFLVHNPTVTLMRTTDDENRQIGQAIGRKVAQSRGPTEVFLPLQGVSAIDQDGQPFDSPSARQRLFEALIENAGTIPCHALDAHINDPSFAQAMAQRLLKLIQSHKLSNELPS